jgi:hypothetical protein
MRRKIRFWALLIAIVLGGAVFFPSHLMVAGGKMRLSEIRTDIDKGYLLCGRSGVRQITVMRD